MSQEGKVRIPAFRDFWTLAGSASQITVVSVFVFFVFFRVYGCKTSLPD